MKHIFLFIFLVQILGCTSTHNKYQIREGNWAVSKDNSEILVFGIAKDKMEISLIRIYQCDTIIKPYKSNLTLDDFFKNETKAHYIFEIIDSNRNSWNLKFNKLTSKGEFCATYKRNDKRICLPLEFLEKDLKSITELSEEQRFIKFNYLNKLKNQEIHLNNLKKKVVLSDEGNSLIRKLDLVNSYLLNDIKIDSLDGCNISFTELFEDSITTLKLIGKEETNPRTHRLSSLQLCRSLYKYLENKEDNNPSLFFEKYYKKRFNYLEGTSSVSCAVGLGYRRPLVDILYEINSLKISVYQFEEVLRLATNAKKQQG